MTNLTPEAILSENQRAMLKEILSTMPIYQPSKNPIDCSDSLPTGIINPNDRLTNPK
jgi:hypothetical protein